jgi:hypothetical protein
LANSGRCGTVQFLVDVLFRREVVDDGVAVGAEHLLLFSPQSLRFCFVLVSLLVGAVEHPVPEREGDGTSPGVVVVDEEIGAGGDFLEEALVGGLQRGWRILVRVEGLFRFSVGPQPIGVFRRVVRLALHGAQAGGIEGGDGDDGALQLVDQLLSDEFVEHGGSGLLGAVDASREPQARPVLLALSDDDGQEFYVACGVRKRLPAAILNGARLCDCGTNCEAMGHGFLLTLVVGLALTRSPSLGLDPVARTGRGAVSRSDLR